MDDWDHYTGSDADHWKAEAERLRADAAIGRIVRERFKQPDIDLIADASLMHHCGEYLDVSKFINELAAALRKEQSRG